MSETSNHLSPENQPVPDALPISPVTEPLAAIEIQPDAANQMEAVGRMRLPQPSSPLERARLESQGKIPIRSELEERSTMVAFGLLFVVPLVVILLAALLLLPFMNAQLTQDADPSGAITQSGANQHQLPPTR